MNDAKDDASGDAKDDAKDDAKATRPDRRRLQLLAAACTLAAGVGAAKILSGGETAPGGPPTPVDCADLPPGRLLTVDWNGSSLWVLRRSPAQLEALAEHESALLDPESQRSRQPAACRNRHRSLVPELFVAIGQCTHQGCTPQLREGAGGAAGAAGSASQFLCPCHASKYDLAGRVFRSGPARANLVIPQYRLESAGRLLIGEL